MVFCILCRLVESVGNKIKRMKPGDKVIPVWQAECQTCPKCRSGRTNICDTFVYNWNSGLMPADKKTTRFSRVSDGAPIYHFFGTSCFSQYTVVDEACVTKINPAADLSKVCLLGCGVSTGAIQKSLLNFTNMHIWRFFADVFFVKVPFLSITM